MRFLFDMHARRTSRLLLILLLLFCPLPAAQAQEAGDIAAEAGVSLEQMAQSIESEVQRQRTALADLSEQLRQMEAAHKKFEAQSKQYDNQNTAHGQLMLMDRVPLENLENVITQRLDPYRDLIMGVLLDDLRSLKDRILAAFQLNNWKRLWSRIQAVGLIPWMILLAALAAIIAPRRRLRRYLKQIEDRCEGSYSHYRRLCLLLLRRSLLYIGFALLFWIHGSVHFSLFDIALGRFLFRVFLALLIARWGMDFVRHGFKGPQTALHRFVSLHLQRFLRFFRIAIITLMVLSLVSGMDSLLAWTARNVVMAALLGLDLVFWRRMKPVVTGQLRKDLPVPDSGRMALIRGTSYLVLGGSLVLNLIGYSALSAQWFWGWAESMVLLFWGWLSFKTLQEFHRGFLAQLAAADRQRPDTSSGHWRWSMIKLGRVVWLLTLTAAFVWIWDPSGIIWPWIERVFSLTFTVGTLNFSIKGMALAVLILFITHLFLRVGRALLKEKVLDRRPIERGLKDSILTIANYLGWALGLVLALGLLGVNTTSLAVVFGALSIGIGFGLQNIFNNFISGLILLFERPIQVGDYVEVAGLWAEVKKINVRSTVVQTFDNASVIIPNSEFISQQVTNWSFKDKRMRRNIEVGVAYESDVELVQQTLLEIASETPGVLKYPRPDVLFIDHAASALLFRLRIWVDVDDYWRVASQIRFEIDRRFRERKIEIAFPQMDLHVRTLPKPMEKTVWPNPAPEASTDS